MRQDDGDVRDIQDIEAMFLAELEDRSLARVSGLGFRGLGFRG